MSCPSGVLSQVGVAKQGSGDANFRTAVAVTDRIPFTSEDFTRTFDRIEQEALLGKAGAFGSEQGVQSVAGTLPVDMNYTYLSSGEFISSDTLLFLAMGSNTWDGVNGVNQLALADCLQESGTLAIDRVTTLWEIYGMMIKEMELSFEINTRLKASFGMSAYDMRNSGLTNTQNDVDTLPLADISHMLGHHATFYITDDFSDPIGSSDKLGIDKATLKLIRNISNDEYTTPEASGHTDAQKPIMPIIDGFRDVQLTLEVPRYAYDTYHNWKANDTMLQAQLEFNAPGGDYLKIFMPHLKIMDSGSPVGGSGKITQTVNMKLHRRDTTYSVMTYADGSTTIDEEFGIELKNDRTAAI